MQYRLSRHAEEELIRRGIPRHLVDQVINSPEQVTPERGGRKAYQSKVEFDGRVFLLRLIVAENINPAMIVTVYRTSKIEKYWSKT